MAEDYNGLLQSLGILRAGVIGHSTGGLIALYAMRRNPELYSRAVLLDPVGALGVKFGPEMLDVFTTMSQDRNFCQTVMAGTIHGGAKENLLNRIVADAFGVHPLIWHGIARALNQVDFREEAARITQPVLVLHGEHDQILPQADSRALAAMLPHGKFLELTGRGHSCNVENPELFVEHVNKFLFG